MGLAVGKGSVRDRCIDPEQHNLFLCMLNGKLPTRTSLVSSCEAIKALETAPELTTTHLEMINPTFEDWIQIMLAMLTLAS